MSQITNSENKNPTKKSIQTALMLLLEEYDWEDITITRITEKAGVSRMAYYRNFKSKEDILTEIFNELMLKLTEKARPYLEVKQWYEFWKILFDYSIEHVDRLKLLLNSNYKLFILDYLNTFCIDIIKPDSVAHRYRIYGLTGLFFNILVEWVEQDMPLSSKDLAQVCYEAVH